MTVSSVKNLNGETFSAVQDASLTDIVSSNSANWNEISAYQANSASYLQDTDLTIVDNKITEISGVPLSAGDEFPQSATDAIGYVTATSGDINATIDNVSANSGVWGGSALPISAGPGIKVNLVDNTLVFSNDETVLWEGSFTTAASGMPLSEAADNFEKLKLIHYWNGNYEWENWTETVVPITDNYFTLFNIAQINNTDSVYFSTHVIKFDTTAHDKLVHVAGYRSTFTNSNPSTTDITCITKVIGIHRIAGGN